jgi:tetratricopeptide (TPR) repeat protein
MATATRSTHGQAAPATSPAPSQRNAPLSERFIEWVKAHRSVSSWIGTGIVVAVGLFLWTQSTKTRSQDIASRELQNARFAFESQNLPLAASGLSRIIENYSGTNAAEESRLLLANVRLLQGQPQQAIEGLRDYAPGAGRAYRAQAYGLLGAAYENLGRFQEAAGAYDAGVEAAQLDFLQAQMLSDAARAWVGAGDTAKAIRNYQRILKDFAKEGIATEAKVRLAELTRGAAS